MKEPTLQELHQLGMSIIGRDLEGTPSKKEEKLAIEVAIKQHEIDSLKKKLRAQKRKLNRIKTEVNRALSTRRRSTHRGK